MRTPQQEILAGLRCLVPLLILLLLSGCAARQPDLPARAPYVPGGLALPDGAPLEDSRFIALAQDADYILIGERHDNATDHAAQARMLRLLAKEGRAPLLGLEMLPRNRYDRVLNRFSQGLVRLDELPEKLDWQGVWGFDFALYEPVFAVCGEFGLPVYGLNISNEVRQAVSRKGLDGLTPKERRELPRRIIPPLPEQREELAGFFRRHHEIIHRKKTAEPHSGTAPRVVAAENGDRPLVMPVTVAALDKNGIPTTVTLPVSLQEPFTRFMLIQSLWDSTMAEQAVAVREKAAPYNGARRPLVILAGGGHVERGYGIAHRLSHISPGSRILSIMPFSGEKPDPAAADIFYYSPARPRLGIALGLRGGMLTIQSVAPGSLAEKAGLVSGDIIVSSRGKSVEQPADLHAAAMAAGRSGLPLDLLVRRHGKELTVNIELK